MNQESVDITIKYFLPPKLETRVINVMCCISIRFKYICEVFMYWGQTGLFLLKVFNCLGGVTVRVLALSAEGHGFDPRLDQTKDMKVSTTFCCQRYKIHPF